jgi:hypothetical protein
MKWRFTLDGSEELERWLEGLCENVMRSVRLLIPGAKLEAIVLGGGYGRGEGGVFRTQQGDRAYNDLEFYVFCSGNRLLNERKFGSALIELGHQLSEKAGLHVEFKLDSFSRLRESPATMFSYDLVSRHRLVFGEESLFHGCQQHLNPETLPLSEATRLLFNRFTGLLLSKKFLRQKTLSGDDTDFIARNMAKAKLAMGDAVLTACGRYHWSCRERDDRLDAISGDSTIPCLEEIRHYHREGVEFKLHPHRPLQLIPKLESQHHALCELGRQLWLWIENRRLSCSFETPKQYAFSNQAKCFGSPAWRNYLLTLRTFGPGALLDPMAGRYPRERLFNTLPLLLWGGETEKTPEIQKRIQDQLKTAATDWSSQVAAYNQVWPAYG